MFTNRQTTATGQGHELWPLLLLLLLAVVVPTACVLWFMTEAAQNERMAVRQKLTDLYQAELADARGALDEHWKDTATALGRYADLPPPQRFAALVTNGVAESVIVLDPAGKPAYPDTGGPPSTNEDLAVAAFRSNVQARVRSGDESGAWRVVEEKLTDHVLANARDEGRRLIMPYEILFVLENTSARSTALHSRIAAMLAMTTADYRQPLPSAQRLFLMQRLAELDASAHFLTLNAELLAATWLAQPSIPHGTVMTAAHSNDLWQLVAADSSAIGLFPRARLATDMQQVIATKAKFAGAKAMVTLAKERPAQEPFLAAPAGSALPDWELRVYLEGANPFAVAAERQVTAYLWTAMLVILVIAIVASLVVRHVLRQNRLTRLKNDFVATVSHELKTPLASMRVLVDTLLDARQQDTRQATEYLELISKENERLSRLIDNFLTFSRMERNKRAFEFADVRPEQIADAAVDTVRERFAAAGFELTVEIAADLPGLYADRDALTTVLLNLLDNACKYSENDKRVAVRVFAADRHVCFEVSDHGIGLSRRDAKKVFDRFYQVDQSLSRRVGGCGLGLSIVKFIVDAHGGTAEVRSRPGDGSTFTVRIPVRPAETSRS